MPLTGVRPNASGYIHVVVADTAIGATATRNRYYSAIQYGPSRGVQYCAPVAILSRYPDLTFMSGSSLYSVFLEAIGLGGHRAT